jgi:hypothetical protein
MCHMARKDFGHESFKTYLETPISECGFLMPLHVNMSVI